MRAIQVAILSLIFAVFAPTARAADRTFPAGSLIIPMDLSYQSRGMLQAYGLLYQLLHHGVRVYWIIDPDKTYHRAPCNTPGDECAWDCAVDGSGVKCAFPTASPDVTAVTKVVWSDVGTARGTAIGTHRYRGGPFAIDAADRTLALAVIDAWNDQALWVANPWAVRSTFNVVTVHEATAAFTGHVSKEMLAAPTIAVFSDGNENIATGYLRAAGIPQSNGSEFPSAKCGANNCGPGTANPDMLTPEAIAGPLGTCGAPNTDHKNGALFRADGLPAYCQIMSMHWDVTTRERVQCGGGNCPATQQQCAPDTPFTFHGHETVAEVRSFLGYPTHFFAECQAVNAYENTTPNPAWPYLDDAGRDGHFLTTRGTPVACDAANPCADGKYQCVAGTCIAKDIRERGAGFLIAPQPNSSTLKVLRPEVPYNQFDGAFGTVGGSEPAYNLSTFEQTEYKNNRQVTFITGPNGPGAADVWMTGYLDGACDIEDPPILLKGQRATTACGGKISYLGGHAFSTSTPVASGSATMGTRMFLNALFEADCVTSAGQPDLALDLVPLLVGVRSLPGEAVLAASYENRSVGAAFDASFVIRAPQDTTLVAADQGGSIAGGAATWDVGSISGLPVRPGDPPTQGTRSSTVRFDRAGDYTFTLELTYTVGSTTLTASKPFTVYVGLDSDGDGVPDDMDEYPDDPNRCGDLDGDGCDDCSSGRYDPANDSPCENPITGDGAGGGCCSADDGPLGPLAIGLFGFVALFVRRTSRGQLRRR
jgi:hypothetical protein